MSRSGKSGPVPGGEATRPATASPLAPVLSRYPDFRVLVVDDSPPELVLIRTILRQFGVEHIDEASDGAGALKILRDRPPHLVISDWEMAPMNGLQFTRHIRESPESPNAALPIIVMTSHTEERRILEIRNAGLADVLAKPVAPQRLSKNILSAMARYEERHAKQANANTSGAGDGEYFDI